LQELIKRGKKKMEKKKKKNGDGVSDAEVENVRKLLMAYKEARSQGLAPLNPQLQVCCFV
jgi:hypothetical protein